MISEILAEIEPWLLLAVGGGAILLPIVAWWSGKVWWLARKVAAFSTICILSAWDCVRLIGDLAWFTVAITGETLMRPIRWYNRLARPATGRGFWPRPGGYDRHRKPAHPGARPHEEMAAASKEMYPGECEFVMGYAAESFSPGDAVFLHKGGLVHKEREDNRPKHVGEAIAIHGRMLTGFDEACQEAVTDTGEPKYEWVKDELTPRGGYWKTTDKHKRREKFMDKILCPLCAGEKRKRYAILTSMSSEAAAPPLINEKTHKVYECHGGGRHHVMNLHETRQMTDATIHPPAVSPWGRYPGG